MGEEGWDGRKGRSGGTIGWGRRGRTVGKEYIYKRKYYCLVFVSGLYN